MEEAQQGVTVAEKEVAVLEGKEQANVNDHRQQDDAPLLTLNASTDGLALVRLRQRQLFLSVACGQFQPQPQVVDGQGGKEQIDNQRPAHRPEKHIAGQQQDHTACPLRSDGVEPYRSWKQEGQVLGGEVGGHVIPPLGDVESWPIDSERS